MMSGKETAEAEAREAREPLLEAQQREDGGNGEASDRDVLHKQEDMERFGLKDALQARDRPSILHGRLQLPSHVLPPAPTYSLFPSPRLGPSQPLRPPLLNRSN